MTSPMYAVPDPEPIDYESLDGSYETWEQLLNAIDDDGVAFFFSEGDPKRIRAAGEVLPPEVTLAAATLTRSLRDLEYWVDRKRAKVFIENFKPEEVVVD